MSDSSLYQELTQTQLGEIVEKHFKVNQFDYSLLQGGMFNTTYLITLSKTEQKYVLRMGPINRHLLLPFEENLMNGETYFCNLCNAQNIPVSTVVACDTERQTIDRDYMLVDYIQSAPLSSLTLSPTQKSAIYEEVGFYTAQIHAISGNQFGRLSHTVHSKGYAKWSEYLKAEVSEWASLVEKTDIFTKEDIERIKQLYVVHTDILDEITQPHLIHADLWEGNILICGDDDHYKVGAIIDGDRAVWGDIDFEFASGWMINDEFMRGYGSHLDMSDKHVLRRKLYSLIYNLLDTYVCLGEYNNEASSLANKNSALKLLNDLYAAR